MWLIFQNTLCTYNVMCCLVRQPLILLANALATHLDNIQWHANHSTIFKSSSVSKIHQDALDSDNGLFFLCMIYGNLVNSLRPSGTYIFHQTRPSMVQIMAGSLFCTMPLSAPMMTYCQLSKNNNFNCTKLIWICHLQTGGHFPAALMC